MANLDGLDGRRHCAAPEEGTSALVTLLIYAAIVATGTLALFQRHDV